MNILNFIHASVTERAECHPLTWARSQSSRNSGGNNHICCLCFQTSRWAIWLPKQVSLSCRWDWLSLRNKCRTVCIHSRGGRNIHQHHCTLVGYCTYGTAMNFYGIHCSLYPGWANCIARASTEALKMQPVTQRAVILNKRLLKQATDAVRSGNQSALTVSGNIQYTHYYGITAGLFWITALREVNASFPDRDNRKSKRNFFHQHRSIMPFVPYLPIKPIVRFLNLKTWPIVPYA